MEVILLRILIFSGNLTQIELECLLKKMRNEYLFEDDDAFLLVYTKLHMSVHIPFTQNRRFGSQFGGPGGL